MENDESSHDFELCNWTRVRCNKIINRKFIQGDLFETGETSKKVAIKNLIMIPDYIASQPRFIFRFLLAGCRDITLEDVNGDFAKYMDTLTKTKTQSNATQDIQKTEGYSSMQKTKNLAKMD